MFGTGRLLFVSSYSASVKVPALVMMVACPERVRLDEDQRDRLTRCLHKSGAKLSSEDIEHFLGRAARAMGTFLSDVHQYAMTDREIHDALRDLCKLASESDPPLGQIRARIKVLPEQVVRQFDRLAPGQIPKYYEDVRNEPMPAAEEPALRAGGFREWAQVADDRALVWAVQTLTTTGVSIVPGRSRGGGKRSRARIEPDILGVARGAGNRASKGGRPPDSDFALGLVGGLAEAWKHATGTYPPRGRSDATGFREAVYSIFQWLDRDGEAEYALRRFWEEFDKN